MNKWVEAVKFDIQGKEDKQRLTKEERVNYSLYLACICFAVAIACLFIPNSFGVIPLIAFAAIGTRKFQIYLHKRKQLE